MTQQALQREKNDMKEKYAALSSQKSFYSTFDLTFQLEK